MLALALNAGSSSLKADVIDVANGARRASVRIERVGGEATLRRDDGAPRACHAPDIASAVAAALTELADVLDGVGAVGHRVVHGGERFADPCLLDDYAVAAIAALSPLAPLHNPANVAAIEAARSALPGAAHVAVFDTAFHATLPRRAREYALPHDLAQRHGIRRYGFHGISHAFVAQAAAAALGADLKTLRLVTLHLGNGCSATAVEYGRSVETSMGLTPLEGLVMGTRAGDVDAGALLHLARAEGLDVDDLDTLLNRQSGLLGLWGESNDMRDLLAAAEAGDERARLALQVFTHRARKYIGAYAAAMGGVDAIVFTGGIGENSADVRHRIAQRLDFLGAHVDEEANRALRLRGPGDTQFFSTRGSRTHLLAVHTDEQLAIARAAVAVAEGAARVETPRGIPIAVSARHVHLRRETLDALFGAGHELTVRGALSQPGQFAAEETVDLVGPRGTIRGVRVLGPLRPDDQVEIARTDEFTLGIDAPVRASGDTANSPGIVLRGPAGEVELRQGVICAWRHIHMTPADARAFGVVDRDVVEVRVEGGSRSLVFGDVLIRVSEKFALEMHIDTDEANAAELGRGAQGVLMATDASAGLTRRRLG